MYSPVADIELLLARSRELLRVEDLNVEALEAWGAERTAIFCRLKEHNPAFATTEALTNESLLRELLDVDAKVRGRLVEHQASLGKQIAALRTMLQALPHPSSRSPQLLQRLV